MVEVIFLSPRCYLFCMPDWHRLVRLVGLVEWKELSALAGTFLETLGSFVSF